MGEWSDYFEDFPEENPANQPDNNVGNGEELRARQTYSSEFVERERKVREAANARAGKSGQQGS